MTNDIKKSFITITNIIKNARENAFRKVNEELITMYWSIGEFLSQESQTASFGDGYMDSMAEFIRRQFPDIKGFTRRGLYRMKQFLFDTLCEGALYGQRITKTDR